MRLTGYRQAICRSIALVAAAAAAFLAVAIVALAAPKRRPFSVGLVLSGPVISRAGDRIQYSAFRGLVQAKRDLKVRAKAVATSPTGSGELAPFDFLARRHFDLVITLAFVPGLSEAARRFPHVEFAALDAARQAFQPLATNVEGTVFHTEQAAYLAGFAAARIADLGRPPHVISSIGGTREPQVQAFIAGFRAGAKRADPKIRLLNTYTDDYLDARKCAHAALSQIAQGSQVVFPVAGNCGLGALEAAKRKGVYGVGVDADQSYLGHRFILTSVVKNLNLAVYDLAKRLVRGRLPTGGNLSYDLRNHGVGLGRFSPVVSLTLRRELRHLARQIKHGKIVAPATLSRSH
jgi:basic membrane protein A and related proteins